MDDTGKAKSLRQRVYMMLFPSAWPGRGLSPANKCVSVLILVSIGLAVLKSEPELFRSYSIAFSVSEYVLTIAFAVE